ncbi:MAG: hypothetical protein ACLUTZ_03630 [Oliverpabstia sp.]
MPAAYQIPALDRLKEEEGVSGKLDTKICIGQGYRGKTGTLGIGSMQTRGLCFPSAGMCPASLMSEIYHL